MVGEFTLRRHAISHYFSWHVLHGCHPHAKKNFLARHMGSSTGLLGAEEMSYMISDLHLNLFGYFHPGFQWSGFLAMFIYPSVNVIFLNYYPHSTSRFPKLAYVAGWTVFCLVFEVAALKSGYFYYTTWKLWNSALCYPGLLMVVLWQSKLTRYLQRRSDASVQ